MALFGRKKRNPLEMTQYQMPANDPMPTMAPGGMGEPYNVQQPQKQKRSVLPYILAAAEDTLARQGGYQPMGVARLNEQAQQRAIAEQRAMEQAAEQRYEAQKLADERAYRRENFLFEKGYERNNPMPDAFAISLERAGIDPNSPEGKQLYRERATNIAQGQQPFMSVNLPNGGQAFGSPADIQAALQGLQGAGGNNAPDTLPPDFFDNPQQQRPQNVPPITGGNRISKAQYDTMLRSMNGNQRQMNEWMRKNNVVVTN